MVSKSPKRFLERRGIVPTYRRPMPTVNLNALRIRGYPLDPPFPSAEKIGYTQGFPVPDRGKSTVWPS